MNGQAVIGRCHGAEASPCQFNAVSLAWVLRSSPCFTAALASARAPPTEASAWSFAPFSSASLDLSRVCARACSERNHPSGPELSMTWQALLNGSDRQKWTCVPVTNGLCHAALLHQAFDRDRHQSGFGMPTLVALEDSNNQRLGTRVWRHAL